MFPKIHGGTAFKFINKVFGILLAGLAYYFHCAPVLRVRNFAVVGWVITSQFTHFYKHMAIKHIKPLLNKK